MDWLRREFDGVRRELAMATESLARQQKALAAMVEAAEKRSAGPADRDEAAMKGAVRVAEDLRSSLSEVQDSAAELRNEIARLAAFRSALASDQPPLVAAVEPAAVRADGRLTALAQRMESLGSRPEWKALRSRLPFRHDPTSGP